MHLLLVEDDELLGDGIQAVLNGRGYEVDWVRDGNSALAVLKQARHDVVILDLNLPELSGFEVLQRLRETGIQVPVLVLTARGEVVDRVRALDGGADDYVVKPFDVDELGARIRALTRRSRGQTTELLRNGDLLMDPAARTLTVGGRPVSLSVKEFAVLQILLENPGRVLSRRHLEQRIYGSGEEVESNAVEVHIHHLRKKLGRNPIRTVRGVGYIIEKSK